MAASLRNVPCRLSKLFWQIRVSNSKYACPFSTESSVQLIQEPNYPPAKPKYPPGKWSEDIPRSIIWKKYEEEQNLLKTGDVRERLETIAGTKDREMIVVSSFDRSPRTLEYKEFITRTKIVNSLPDLYTNVDVEAEYQTLKPYLIDAILFEHEYFTRSRGKINILHCHQPEFRSRRLMSNIVDTMLSVCSHNYPHLLSAQVDNDVRVETCWKIDGFKMANVKNHFGRTWLQYKGTRAKQMRTELPLPEFLPADDEVCTGGDFPVVDYSPRAHGFRYQKGRPFTVAGHWIGDPCEFTHLSVEALGLKYQSMMKKFDNKPELMDGVWKQCGLTSAFSTCMAQAHNLGFNIFSDLTYPITTQTVIVEENYMQLFAYQLNTMHMWQTREANPKNNIVFVGNKYKLYNSIENGKIQGFNDEAFMSLLKFVLLEPVDRGCDLRPYVADDHVAANKKLFINMKGDEPLHHEKIGRYQYPRHAVYF